jgi:hypothetical protein
MRQIMLALGAEGACVFRQNVGQAWVGRVIERGPRRITLADPRPFHAGLCKGSSDLIGWRPVIITPDMVGKPAALFVAIETKTARGRATPEQQHFVDTVKAAGGCAGIARTIEQAVAILRREQ